MPLLEVPATVTVSVDFQVGTLECFEICVATPE